MTMVIECEACQARFRLDRGLFKGARAIRVRCRKCGASIVVANPDIPEAAPPSFAEEPPQRSAPPAAAPAEAPVPAAEPTPPVAEASPASTADLPPAPAVEPPPPSFAEEPPLPFVPPATTASEPEPPEPAEAAAPPEAPVPPEPPGPAAGATAYASVASLLDDLLSESRGASPGPPPPDRDPPPASRFESKPGRRYPAQPAESKTVSSALDDLFSSVPATDPESDGYALDDAPATFIPLRSRRMPDAERPPYTRPMFLAGAVLWLLLLAGGALFFGTPRSGGKFGRSLLPSLNAAPATGTTVKSTYEIRDVTWDTFRKTDAGDLFVVRGTVVNAGPGDSNGIRVQATLMGTDNQALGERDVFAGNTIDDATLRHASPAVLKGALNKRFGDGEKNRNIPPGGSLPFLIVFFDPPENVGSILVKGVDAP